MVENLVSYLADLTAVEMEISKAADWGLWMAAMMDEMADLKVESKVDGSAGRWVA